MNIEEIYARLFEAPIVPSRVGNCHELRNQILTISKNDISHIEEFVDQDELAIEIDAFYNGVSANSKREFFWGNKPNNAATYGFPLFRQNRLTEVIDKLNADHNTRQAHIQIDYLPQGQPCGTSFNFAIRNNKFLTTITFRSLDAANGLPTDALVFFDLHQLAHQMIIDPEIELGDLTFFATSLHLYT